MDRNQYLVHQVQALHLHLHPHPHPQAHHPMTMMTTKTMTAHHQVHHLIVVQAAQVLQRQVHHRVLDHHLANVKVQM